MTNSLAYSAVFPLQKNEDLGGAMNGIHVRVPYCNV